MDLTSAVISLSQATQMNLQLMKAGEGYALTAPAGGTEWQTLAGPLHLNMKHLRVVVSDSLGILFHVAGDLYMYMNLYFKNHSLSAYLLDASQLQIEMMRATPDRFIKPKMPLREVIDAVKPAIVQSFLFRTQDKKWLPFDLPPSA